MEVFPGWEIHVDEYSRSGRQAIYTYDYGDSWEHEFMLERDLLREVRGNYPRVLQAKGLSPGRQLRNTGYREFMKTAKEGKKVKIASLFDDKPLFGSGAFVLVNAG
jgi:hypothetical protein